VAYPTVHDRFTHFGLRLAKRNRSRYATDRRDFYEQFFLEKHIDESKYDLRARLRREAIKHALCETKNTPKGVIADIGFGVGDVIESMPIDAAKIAVSYSRADLGLARSICDPRISFINASIFDLPLASNSVDIILCLEVIEHLPDDRAAIRELARVLKSSGLLLVSGPSHHYYPDYLELIGHYRHYSRESLNKLLESENLRVVRYIDTYPLATTIHYYPYMILQAIHSTLNKLGWTARSMYVRPSLGAVYQRVARVLSMFVRERSQTQLHRSEKATFVAVEKIS
jgi:ubiquinone/menaquinone biosynthesis C-methylase UbiE